MVVNDNADLIVDEFGLDLDFKDPVVGDKKIDTDTPDPIELGGDRFDKAGNLIKDNKIIKTKEEIDAQKSAVKPKEGDDKFDIDDDKDKDSDNDDSVEKYELDKDGNLLKNKELFKKKGEFTINDKGEVSLETKGFVDALVDMAKTQGYEFTDADGNPITFEDSDTGYLELARAIGVQEATKDINTFLTTYDPVQELFVHLQAGGNAEEFYNKKANLVDYTKYEKPTEAIQQELLVLDMFKKVYNMPEDKAKEMVTLIKDSNNLETKSLEALAALTTWQKDSLNKEKEENLNKIQKQEDERINTLKAINTTIKQGKLGDILIPEKERSDFYNYITQEVKPGTTKSTEAYQNLSIDQQLMIDYLVYKNLSLEDLIKIKARSDKADLIKQRASNNRPIIVSPQFSNNQAVSVDTDDVK